MRNETGEDLVRQCFRAWEENDRATLETLLADDFTFTSPNDDHISRAEYWKRCWANSDVIESYQIRQLMSDGDDVMIRYTCTLRDGKRFSNMEHFCIRDGQIGAVEVYFGRGLEPATN